MATKLYITEKGKRMVDKLADKVKDYHIYKFSIEDDILAFIDDFPGYSPEIVSKYISNSISDSSKVLNMELPGQKEEEVRAAIRRLYEAGYIEIED